MNKTDFQDLEHKITDMMIIFSNEKLIGVYLITII